MYHWGQGTLTYLCNFCAYVSSFGEMSRKEARDAVWDKNLRMIFWKHSFDLWSEFCIFILYHVFLLIYTRCSSGTVKTRREPGPRTMEPTVTEESAQYDTTNNTNNAFSYDDVFPALPESNSVAAPTSNTLGQWNNKMRISTSNIAQVCASLMKDLKANRTL